MEEFIFKIINLNIIKMVARNGNINDRPLMIEKSIRSNLWVVSRLNNSFYFIIFFKPNINDARHFWRFIGVLGAFWVQPFLGVIYY